MNEPTNTSEKKTEVLEALSDILLVLDKNKNRIEAVKGVDDKGNLKTVAAKMSNILDFMRIDKGDAFSNFFSNFLRRLNDPFQFRFFKAPAMDLNEIGRKLQEAKTEDQRRALIKATNEGKIRVLFGSTEMLGTGVNAQKRAVAVHHLDIPWRPSDLEQRDGRAVRKGNEIAKFFAGNEVDVFIYAVEKSLDAYKFNTLANKQRFIGQLKSNSLGVRTIDEGGMDESSGMNFAEYVALLSGNTELLEKAKVEKKIAALESEKQAFIRSKWSSVSKLEHLVEELEARTSRFERISGDWNNFQQRVQRSKEGNVLNPILLHGVSKDAGIKEIGAKLSKLAAVSQTGGDYGEIGSLYGFHILVKTEVYDKAGSLEHYNRFFICGEGNIKYTHNNGIITSDPERASLNFLKALQKLPNLIEIEGEKIEYLRKDRTVLNDMINSVWSKDKLLADLKTELASIERQIQVSLDSEQGRKDPVENTETFIHEAQNSSHFKQRNK